MKILIVEDDQLLANSLKELLEGQNYQVDTVYDGEMGADYYLTKPFDSRELLAKKAVLPVEQAWKE